MHHYFYNLLVLEKCSGALGTEQDPQCQILTQMEQKARPRFYSLGIRGKDKIGECK